MHHHSEYVHTRSSTWGSQAYVHGVCGWGEELTIDVDMHETHCLDCVISALKAYSGSSLWDWTCKSKCSCSTLLYVRPNPAWNIPQWETNEKHDRAKTEIYKHGLFHVENFWCLWLFLCWWRELFDAERRVFFFPEIVHHLSSFNEQCLRTLT